MLPPLALERHPVAVTAAAAGALGLLGWGLYSILRDRPTPAEIERLRRERLTRMGRLVAGVLFDALPTETSPNTLFYRYSIAGVEYECAQDVSSLTYRIVDALMLDFPVLVRFDRANPPDSIVLAEEWSGLHAQAGEAARSSGTRTHLHGETAR